MVSSQPYRFTNLPKLSKAQVALQESLAVHLSYLPFGVAYPNTLEEIITEVVGAPCLCGDLQLQTIHSDHVADLAKEIACWVVIGTAPATHQILVDLDIQIAASVVDRMLGGKGEPANIQRALTQLETGVLSYLLLHILNQINSQSWHAQDWALSLERFAHTYEGIQELATTCEYYQLLGLTLQVGDLKGYVRLFIPDTLMTRSFASPMAEHQLTLQERGYVSKTLLSLADTEVMARLVISGLDLQPVDMLKIEPGDIVILENHQLKLTDQGLEGRIFLILGAGKNGYCVGQLIHDAQGEPTQIEVIEIVTQQEPTISDITVPEVDPATNPEPDPETAAAVAAVENPVVESQPVAAAKPNLPPTENLEQTYGLLRDIEAPVVVELGRLRLSAAQVVRLRVGQIIRLPRGHNEPVDLVIGNKVFARGELVDVEGELGVRLNHVAGVD